MYSSIKDLERTNQMADIFMSTKTIEKCMQALPLVCILLDLEPMVIKSASAVFSTSQEAAEEALFIT